mmetsp:Transcript_39362/g.111612  ORF Transcript_39362/g.111612 Transcript_39362/m.111612 type:complete len:310 (-) Transcript_39362:61-990(-)
MALFSASLSVRSSTEKRSPCLLRLLKAADTLSITSFCFCPILPSSALRLPSRSSRSLVANCSWPCTASSWRPSWPSFACRSSSRSSENRFCASSLASATPFLNASTSRAMDSSAARNCSDRCFSESSSWVLKLANNSACSDRLASRSTMTCSESSLHCAIACEISSLLTLSSRSWSCSSRASSPACRWPPASSFSVSWETMSLWRSAASLCLKSWSTRRSASSLLHSAVSSTKPSTRSFKDRCAASMSLSDSEVCMRSASARRCSSSCASRASKRSAMRAAARSISAACSCSWSAWVSETAVRTLSSSE